jgi:carbon-monoxide dehydrogenase medium subunit
LGRIPDLAGIAMTPSHVTVGATTRTARLIDGEVSRACPLLTAAARLVAHPQIRNRGTVGGSIANADPAAELPAVALLTGATIRLRGPAGDRSVDAADFFQGMFTTACDWNEIVVGIDFPCVPAGTGWGFREFARRPGDFALAGVGAILHLRDGSIVAVRIIVFGIGSHPVRITAAEGALSGQPPSPALLRHVRATFEAALEPGDSMFAAAEYRRQIAGVLFERVIADAVDRANGVLPEAGHA